MRRAALLIIALTLTACQPATPTGANPSAPASPASPASPGASTAPAGPNTPASPASPSANAPGTPVAAGMRTYANTIKPITSSQNCRTCHTNGAGSSYEFDAARKATIVRMAQTNGGRAGLNAQQVADIQAWFNAGGPNDPTTF